MIEYKKFTLDNGLRVLIHEDKSTPIITINTVFDVGAKDEDEIRTGFAHLFEHLMFGGSVIFQNLIPLFKMWEVKIMHLQVTTLPIITLLYRNKTLKLVCGWKVIEC